MASKSTSATTVPSINPPTRQHSPPTTAEITASRTSSTSSSDSDDLEPTNIASRPKVGSRQQSGTMIVPADHPELEIKEETFPPHDMRAMSPRRSSADTDKLIGAARSGLQSQAIEQQYALNALVEKVESIKSDHDKLSSENSALQDYIGGLTRSMSKTALQNKK